MKTIRDVLFLSISFLQKKGIDDPRRDVERLIAHCLKMRRLDLYLHFDRPIEEDELTTIRDGLFRLAEREPIQYIEGVVPFFNILVEVSTSVLIPRPETETLVEKVCNYISREGLEESRLLDLCTGSGCIGIAIKKKFPDLQVTLSDYSVEALDVAKKNAILNEVKVEFVHSDLFTALDGRVFDCIVSNPPYVSLQEYETLDSGLIRYEPQIALLAGSDGLDYYRKIAAKCDKHLQKPGVLWLEIGASQKKLLLHFSPLAVTK